MFTFQFKTSNQGNNNNNKSTKNYDFVMLHNKECVRLEEPVCCSDEDEDEDSALPQQEVAIFWNK